MPFFIWTKKRKRKEKKYYESIGLEQKRKNLERKIRTEKKIRKKWKKTKTVEIVKKWNENKKLIK